MEFALDARANQGRVGDGRHALLVLQLAALIAQEQLSEPDEKQEHERSARQRDESHITGCWK
jgi:hypothetical protein